MSSRPACYVVTGVTVYSGEAVNPLNNADILVQNGVITCMKESGACVVPDGCLRYALVNGVVIPGMELLFSVMHHRHDESLAP